VLVGVSVANIQREQNTRVAVGSKQCNHITPVLTEHHRLPIQYRIQYGLTLLIFKALMTQQPYYLHKLISVRNPARQLRSSELMLLHNDKNKLSFADRAFCHAAPTFGNLFVATYPLVLLH
jgi:hypothetical protein